MPIREIRGPFDRRPSAPSCQARDARADPRAHPQIFARSCLRSPSWGFDVVAARLDREGLAALIWISRPRDGSRRVLSSRDAAQPYTGPPIASEAWTGAHEHHCFAIERPYSSDSLRG